MLKIFKIKNLTFPFLSLTHILNIYAVLSLLKNKNISVTTFANFQISIQSLFRMFRIKLLLPEIRVLLNLSYLTYSAQCFISPPPEYVGKPFIF